MPCRRREAHSRPGELIEVRGLHDRVPGDAEAVVAELVGDEEQDIRPWDRWSRLVLPSTTPEATASRAATTPAIDRRFIDASRRRIPRISAGWSRLVTTILRPEENRNRMTVRRAFGHWSAMISRRRPLLAGRRKSG